jgi:hypothetical protein
MLYPRESYTVLPGMIEHTIVDNPYKHLRYAALFNMSEGV